MLSRRAVALAAIFAVAFAALWPLVSAAKPRAAGVPSFICTQAGGPHAPAPGGDAGDDFHCPLCIASAAFIAPSPLVVSPQPLQLEFSGIAAPHDAVHDLYVPRPPPSRAPPLSPEAQ